MQFPEDSIGNVVKSVDKWTFGKAGNQQHELIVGGSVEAQTPDHLIKSPLHPSNISDLTPKPVRTIAYKWLIFIQFEYKNVNIK